MDRNGMEIKLSMEGMELHNECLDAGSLGVHLMGRDLLLG
jgi:hypothetical protein